MPHSRHSGHDQHVRPANGTVELSHQRPLAVDEEMSMKKVPGPCSVVRENPHPGRGTVLVLGTPRGGTSVVAGICHMIGVPMGLDIDHSNVEDREFRRIMQSDERTQLLPGFLERLHNSAPIAGAKDPTVIDHLHEVTELLPDPVYVVASRDVYTATQREVVEGHDFVQCLRSTMKRKYAIIDFVESTRHPVIVVSYERLMQDPIAAIRSLGDFLMGGVTEQLIRRTAGMVRPHADMPNDVDFVDSRTRYDRELSRLGGALSA